jgi:putative nucleotidyltransferase with HDIG domain
MRLDSNDGTAFRSMADLIRLDAGFAEQVLRVASLPPLGSREKIDSVFQALAILGLDRLKGIVMTVALRDLLSTVLANRLLLRCWRHSLACALLCQEMAEARWLEQDCYYTAGLLHDLGRLSLLATYPDDYAALLETADAGEGECRDLRECERRLFGADHCEIGHCLAEDWQFDAELREAMGAHHAPVKPGRSNLRSAVRLACRTADALGFQAAGPAPPTRWDELQLDFARCGWDRMKPEHQLLPAVAARINAIECSLPAL